jgi:hypothetical protein
MYSIKLSENFTGLCNQLFALVNGIIEAKNRGCTQMSVSTFAPKLNSPERVPISQILDLEKISKEMDIQIHVGPTLLGALPNIWYTFYNELLFIRLLKCIHFKSVFHELAQELFIANITDKVFHVVHFRIEQDAIKHWARMNEMTEEIFTEHLYTQYRKAITESIPEGSQILALTFNTNHPLLDELAQKYHIIALDTEELLIRRVGIGGREICAIIDLLVGIRCTGTFIGCHNLVYKRGSSFSYILWRLMDYAERGVFLDLDDIDRGLQVWYN